MYRSTIAYPTKAISLMQTHCGIEPVFEATDDYLKTVLLRSKGHHDSKNVLLNVPLKRDKGSRIKNGDLLNEIQVQLLNALRAKPRADYALLAETLGISPAKVKRHIRKLKNIGHLKRIGSKKTGYWEVVE